MAGREEIRAAITSLYARGKQQIDIARSLGVSKQLVSKAIKRYNEQGHNLDRNRSGRPRTADTPRNRKIIRERIRRNFKRSMRSMAREIGISEGSVRNIVHKRLGHKSLKLQKGHHLTDKLCEVRKRRCRELLRRHGVKDRRKILFSDEKFFCIEQAHNVQNDRVLAPNAQSANRRGRTISRIQKPAGVMVWAGVTATGKTPLVFIESGIKINAERYIKDVLDAVVLPWSQSNLQNESWIFQQDSAPSHRARVTQNWCKDNFPDFISSEEWPPYSPDLNPLDYSLWGILESKACASSHTSVASLKLSLQRTWDAISQETVRAAVEQFPKRLRACIAANGSYFENNLH